MIAYDLYRSIIKYIPMAGLRDLSKASPIFDEMIYKMGIKIFYENQEEEDKVIVHKLTNDHVVILANSGKKHLLLDLGDCYEYNCNAVYKEEICWVTGKDDVDVSNCFAFYSPKNCIYAYLRIDKTVLSMEICNSNRCHGSINIVIGPLNKFNNICMETRMLLMYDGNNLHVGTFSIMYRHGLFEKK